MSMAKYRPGRNYGGKTEAARKAERRQLLLEAAISVYAEVGYHSATVRQICKRANLTARYFYESFKNGEELFEACYEFVVDEIVTKAVAAAKRFPNDRRAQVLAFQRTYFSELKQKPKLARLFLMDMTSVSPRIQQRFSRSINMVADQFADQAPIYHDEEKVRDLVSRALIAGVIYISRKWVEEDFSTPIDTLLEATQTLYGISE